mmetsp:Transcript_7246/g.30072  ORF Transcript_7246/g.30072 Transcript_7246/m.30072 type:complete len:339 (+) Transcript_7246:2033-3049(+)
MQGVVLLVHREARKVPRPSVTQRSFRLGQPRVVSFGRLDVDARDAPLAKQPLGHLVRLHGLHLGLVRELLGERRRVGRGLAGVLRVFHFFSLGRLLRLHRLFPRLGGRLEGVARRVLRLGPRDVRGVPLRVRALHLLGVRAAVVKHQAQVEVGRAVGVRLAARLSLLLRLLGVRRLLRGRGRLRGLGVGVRAGRRVRLTGLAAFIGLVPALLEPERRPRRNAREQRRARLGVGGRATRHDVAGLLHPRVVQDKREKLELRAAVEAVEQRVRLLVRPRLGARESGGVERRRILRRLRRRLRRLRRLRLGGRLPGGVAALLAQLVRGARQERAHHRGRRE